MTCPPEIAEVLAEMIRNGLLRIRGLGYSGRADLCAIEADHLHDLPALISHYSPECLEHYWNVSRRCYLEQMPDLERSGWEASWEKLAHAAGFLVEPVGLGRAG